MQIIKNQMAIKMGTNNKRFNKEDANYIMETIERIYNPLELQQKENKKSVNNMSEFHEKTFKKLADMMFSVIIDIAETDLTKAKELLLSLKKKVNENIQNVDYRLHKVFIDIVTQKYNGYYEEKEFLYHFKLQIRNAESNLITIIEKSGVGEAVWFTKEEIDKIENSLKNLNCVSLVDYDDEERGKSRRFYWEFPEVMEFVRNYIKKEKVITSNFSLKD